MFRDFRRFLWFRQRLCNVHEISGIWGKLVLIVNLITYKNLFLETFFNDSTTKSALFPIFSITQPTVQGGRVLIASFDPLRSAA